VRPFLALSNKGKATQHKVLWLKATIPGLEFHDVLRVEGEDHVSAPFSFELIVRIKENTKVPDLIGKPVMVEVLTGKDNKPKDHARYFHGLVAETFEPTFVPDEKNKDNHYRLLHLTLRPHFWFLSLTKDSQTFQEQSALDIVKKLLQEKKIEFKDKVRGSGKTKRPFCVQYNESDFAFISRLLEESGIGYYFVYEKNKHEMVLLDQNSAGVKFKDDLTFWHMSSGSAPGGDLNRLWWFERTQRPVVSEFSANDYFFEKPTQDLHKKAPGKIKSALKFLFYDHLCSFGKKGESDNDGEDVVKQRIEGHEWGAVQMEGRSTYADIAAGSIISTKKCAPSALNGDYFVISVKHRYGVCDEGVDFDNTFTCIDQKKTYRPPLVHKRPRIWGFVTAIVTGKKGEEVWSDKYGAIKVKFYWDYRAKDDETSSCWVRVATASASSHWGIIGTPRIGQEVIVQFEEGNPERPVVVGCLYNGIHMPPYGEKDDVYKDKMYKERTKGKIRSVWKTHSTPKGGAKNFNEICLTDDKGKEEVFIQAEKDYRTLVKDHKVVVIQKGNQETTLESGDRKVTLEGKDGGSKGKGHDVLILLKGDRTTEIKEGKLKTTLDKGDEEHTLKKGSQKITIEHGDQEIKISKGKRSVTIKSDDKLEISGGWTVKVKGKLSFDAKGGIKMSTPGNFDISCMNFNVKANMGAKIDCTNLTMNAKMSANVKANMQLSMKGQAQASLGGAMVSVNGSAMTQVKGAMVMIN
jgi:type VI secretion system secreted protein VgrG